MVSLSFECYAYEHGAEIGMWISVNLDLILYIVYCTAALTWPTPWCTWGWILVIVVIACWLNFVNILNTMLLFFLLSTQQSLKILCTNRSEKFHAFHITYHKHNLQLVWCVTITNIIHLCKLYGSRTRIRWAPYLRIAPPGSIFGGPRCHWSTFG